MRPLAVVSGTAPNAWLFRAALAAAGHIFKMIFSVVRVECCTFLRDDVLRS